MTPDELKEVRAKHCDPLMRALRGDQDDSMRQLLAKQIQYAFPDIGTPDQRVPSADYMAGYDAGGVAERDKHTRDREVLAKIYNILADGERSIDPDADPEFDTNTIYDLICDGVEARKEILRRGK